MTFSRSQPRPASRYPVLSSLPPERRALLQENESAPAQVAALSAVLDISKGPTEEPFLPASLSVAVELLLCSRHTGPELLAVLADHCSAFIDVRCVVWRPVERFI